MEQEMEKKMEKEKKKKKQAEKENRQQIASDWITENYLQWERLRVDTVRQRIQIMTERTLTPPTPSKRGLAELGRKRMVK